MCRRDRSLTRFMAALLAASLVGIIAVACRGGGAGPETDANGAAGVASTKPATKLRILNSFALTALDPAKGANWLVQFGSGEALTWTDDNGVIQPWLLQSFHRVDPTTWKRTVRPNVTFQNGKPLTAKIAVASLERQVKLNAAAKELLGTATFEATGDLEITLRTPAPDAFVLGKLAEYTAFPIYDVDLVEAAGATDEALLGKGFYSGPYAPVAFTKDKLELVRFDGYWGGTPALPGVSLTIVADPQARLAAMQSGEADLALYSAIETKGALKSRKDAHFITAKQGKESLQIVMNQRVAPFNDLAVRRAFGLAIDYKAIATQAMDGVYDTAESLYPLSMAGAIANQETDLEQARQLLDQAGWTVGSDGIRQKDGKRLEIVLLTYPQQPDTATAAVAIQSQVKNAGFGVSILSSEDINASLNKRDASWGAGLIFNGTISGASGIPNIALSRYLGTGSASNYSGVSDPELDQLIADLNGTFDEAKQQQILKRVQEIVIGEQAYLLVASYKAFPMVTSPDWSGFEPALYRRWVKFDTVPVRAK